MTAIGLIFGQLTAEHYENGFAADPRIDVLREKMTCVEDSRFSQDYLDPSKRSIANAVQIYFANGTHTHNVEVAYPIGHRRRRSEAVPLLEEKCTLNLKGRFPEKQVSEIMALMKNAEKLASTPVHQFLDLFVI
jgi:2-methylcitrate dehydratase PrpD